MNLPACPFWSLTDIATLNYCWNNMNKWPNNDYIFICEWTIPLNTVLRRTGVLCSQGWNGLCRDLQFISSASAVVPTGCALSFWVTHWGELRAAVCVCVQSALDQTEMNLMRVCVCALEDRSETELLRVLLCPTQRRLQNKPGAMLTTTHTGSHTHTHTRSLSHTQKHARSLISTLSLWLRFSCNHQSDHTAGVVTLCRYLMFNIKVLIQHNNHWSHKRLEIRHSFPEVFTSLTYPVASQTSASALGLYSSEEGKVAEFGKHQ